MSHTTMTRSVRSIRLERPMQHEDMLDRFLADVNGGEEEIDCLGEVRKGD